MATSLKKQVEAARKRLDKARDAVYAFAPNGQTVFSECLKLASANVVTAYETARDSVYDLEAEAVAKCKAYRSSSGGIIWYR
jgi:hypothetical protein